jgi:hypothetical protein
LPNKWANKLNLNFSKEELQMANKHMKKMFNIFILELKTTLRFHLSVRKAYDPRYVRGGYQEDYSLPGWQKVGKTNGIFSQWNII